MYIITPKRYIIEARILPSASQLTALQKQMAENEKLNHTLTIPLVELIKEQPKYKFMLPAEDFNLFVRKYKSLYGYICRFCKTGTGVFIKTTTGLFVGLVDLIFERGTDEESDLVIDNILLFSFGLSPKEDENMIQKELPVIIERGFKKFSRIIVILLINSQHK
jgi:hypothetical protein